VSHIEEVLALALTPSASQTHTGMPIEVAQTLQ
jgi:hypothetical protein